MTKKKVDANDQDAQDEPEISGGSVLQSDGTVRVWSSVGVTIPVSADPPAFLRFSFGHERLAKNSSQEEVRRVAAVVDEFNESELERRMKKYVRLVASVSEEDEKDAKRKRKGKGKHSDDPRERARARLHKRSK